MTTAYYKSTDPAVIKAWNDYNTESDKVYAAGKLLAKIWKGKPWFRAGLRGTEFAGLTFDPVKEHPFWTKPDRFNGIQKPRASLAKATKEDREALKSLREEWNADYPKERTNFDPVLAAMGTSYGATMMTGPLSMFVFGGAMYVMCGVKLAPCFGEILASEYEARKKDFETQKKKAKES
jgi:hypothetical protein